MLNEHVSPYEDRRRLIARLSSELDALSPLLDQYPEVYVRISTRVVFSILDSLSYCLREDLKEVACIKRINYESKIPGAKEVFQLRTKIDGIVEEYRPNLLDGFKGARKFFQWLIGQGHLETRATPAPLGALPINFKEAEDVRHRLTHPKQAADYDITNEEAAAIRGTLRWAAELTRSMVPNKEYISSVTLMFGGTSHKISKSIGWPKRPLPEREGKAWKKGDPLPTLPEWVPPLNDK